MADIVCSQSSTPTIIALPAIHLVQFALWETGADSEGGGIPDLDCMETDGSILFWPAPGRHLLYTPGQAEEPQPAFLIDEASGCATDLSHSRIAYVVAGRDAAAFRDSNSSPSQQGSAQPPSGSSGAA